MICFKRCLIRCKNALKRILHRRCNMRMRSLYIILTLMTFNLVHGQNQWAFKENCIELKTEKVNSVLRRSKGQARISSKEFDIYFKDNRNFELRAESIMGIQRNFNCDRYSNLACQMDDTLDNKAIKKLQILIRKGKIPFSSFYSTASRPFYQKYTSKPFATIDNWFTAKSETGKQILLFFRVTTYHKTKPEQRATYVAEFVCVKKEKLKLSCLKTLFIEI